MGLSKVISTLIGVTVIITLIVTLVTKPHDPLSSELLLFGLAATMGMGPGLWTDGD